MKCSYSIISLILLNFTPITCFFYILNTTPGLGLSYFIIEIESSIITTHIQSSLLHPNMKCSFLLILPFLAHFDSFWLILAILSSILCRFWISTGPIWPMLHWYQVSHYSQKILSGFIHPKKCSLTKCSFLLILALFSSFWLILAPF